MRGQFCPYDHGTDPVVWQNAPTANGSSRNTVSTSTDACDADSAEVTHARLSTSTTAWNQ